MIAAEDWAQRTGWTDPSRSLTPARTATKGIPNGRFAGQVVLSGSMLGNRRVSWIVVISGVEIVALAPSQGYEWPGSAA
jgi:hypothetical protein